MFNNILVICPKFHGYENKIKDNLNGFFNVVDCIFYDESGYLNIQETEMLKIKIKRLLTGRKSKELKCDYLYKNNFKHLNDLVSNKKGHYDRLLVIKGFGLYPETIENINSSYKVIYQWDKLSRYPIVERSYGCFDQVFSFDKEDSQLGFGKYLPNFICKNIRKESIIYDVFYVGSYSTERYDFFKSAIKKYNEMGVRYFIKLIGGDKKDDFVQDKNILKVDYDKFLSRSMGVIEFSRKEQSGFTQRYYEGILNKKVILSFDGLIVPKDEVPFNLNCKDNGEFDILNLKYKFNKVQNTELPDIINKLEIKNWIRTVLSL